jgi:hypothetical protein
MLPNKDQAEIRTYRHSGLSSSISVKFSEKHKKKRSSLFFRVWAIVLLYKLQYLNRGGSSMRGQRASGDPDLQWQRPAAAACCWWRGRRGQTAASGELGKIT